MTIFEAIEQRHTIRNYDGKAIEGDRLHKLCGLIDRVNREDGLRFQLVNGRRDVLAPFEIHYGRWTNVTNMIALIGREAADLEQRCGYYGEQIVLWAEQNGLKTGWVETALAGGVPEFLSMAEDERLVLSICIGTSEQVGRPHRVKPIEELSTVEGAAPDWFLRGMTCAQLAPSAGNQQLFCIGWDGEHLRITTKPGFLEMVDVGIAQYHFEIGAGVEHDRWSD